jgi:hypothetical protein
MNKRGFRRALPTAAQTTDRSKKPFWGVTDSQVQLHSSSLPSVTNTEENEGNEEQHRGNLICDSKVARTDPSVSSEQSVLY